MIKLQFFGPLENLHARFSSLIHAYEIGISCSKISLLVPKLSLPPFKNLPYTSVAPGQSVSPKAVLNIDSLLTEIFRKLTLPDIICRFQNVSTSKLQT